MTDSRSATVTHVVTDDDTAAALGSVRRRVVLAEARHLTLRCLRGALSA